MIFLSMFTFIILQEYMIKLYIKMSKFIFYASKIMLDYKLAHLLTH
jgi:hypothetical protein